MNLFIKLVLFVVFYLIKFGAGICFFPVEYQGVFSAQLQLMQEKKHIYSRVTILPDGIPIWGLCESRAGNTVILRDLSSGKECTRCFHLYLRSPNVIQVYTEATDRCYGNKEMAAKSCPSMQHIRNDNAREFTLYKTRSFEEDGKIRLAICPFVGRYHFSYGAFDGKRRKDMCLDTSSLLTTCPRASQLKLRFRACTFGNLDLHLECLGAWTGFDDVTYVALYDPDVKSDSQPRYRCGMYHKSPSGRVALSLSADSSCHKQLISPWQGFESLSLTPLRPPAPPSIVFETSCNFPQWSQGEWQNMKFTGNQFQYQDEATEQVVTAFCLSKEVLAGERFSLYTINQCGREKFACIWLKSRSPNVLEFILTSGQSDYNTSAICSDDQMWKQSWITQGRKLKSASSCPINGQFLGKLPDDPSLCARLTSDCSRSDFLHHEVFPCSNKTQPYEERYYQCLGEWREGGVTFIYTWRRDVLQFECFAGVEVSKDQVFLLEAGPTCRRGLQPLAQGMKITRKSTCSEQGSSSFRRESEIGLAHGVSNRVESYDSREDMPRWRLLGGKDRKLPFSSSAKCFDFVFSTSILCFTILRLFV